MGKGRARIYMIRPKFLVGQARLTFSTGTAEQGSAAYAYLTSWNNRGNNRVFAEQFFARGTYY